MTNTAGHLGAGSHTGVHRRGGRQRSESVSFRRLWDRELDHYPDTTHRYMYLAIVVLAAIVLYYEFYVQAAVTPSILVHFGMTFPFFVYVLVVGNLVGAFASLVAGLADRWGRANMVAYGLLITALIALIGLPYAPNLWAYGVFYAILGFVEGVILVATPALIRDFSPQLGRASAMAFWTMGPVIASLTVAEVSSHTLNHLYAWQDQFIIAGIVGLVVFAIAFVGLRELSPGLRDQLMVSARDRVLVEARAAGVDVEASLRHPWRQMAKLDIVGPALGIGVFLVIYYTLIAFLVVFMASIFHYTQLRANLLGNWIWAFNAIALIVVGVVSDKVRVRKPFMLVGAAVAMISTAFFAITTTHSGTGYYTFVWILSLLAVGIGLVFSPWLASFTETAEERNPALVATGLAIWGWVLRLMVAGSFLILPFVVTTMTPIVEHGAQVQTLVAKYPAASLPPATLATLQKNPTNAAALAQARAQLGPNYIKDLVSLASAPKADVAYLATYGPKVQSAAAAAPGEWQRWWWICFGCEALLIPTIFVMRGRWSPKAARADDAAHEALVEAELARMSQG